MTKNVLVTGMSGLIGGLLKKHLTSVGGYKLKALNRSNVNDVETHKGDISDLGSIKDAFLNQDTVVHLRTLDQKAGNSNMLIMWSEHTTCLRLPE